MVGTLRRPKIGGWARGVGEFSRGQGRHAVGRHGWSHPGTAYRTGSGPTIEFGMRWCDGLAVTLSAIGLAAGPIGGGRAAWARADLNPTGAASSTRRPTAPGASTSPPLWRPSPLASKPESLGLLGTSAAPWSVGRRIGVGMMLAAPLLATGGLYYRSKADADPTAMQNPCAACASHQSLDGDRFRRQDNMQWLLLGAGVATFAGGGLLFWLKGAKTERDSAPRAALRFGRDGSPSAVVVGSF